MSDQEVTLPFPGVVVIDTRERRPFTFLGLRSDAKQKYRILEVQTVAGTLGQGDYSILGHERWLAIERKSLPDLFGTIGHGRDRFESELSRLQALTFAAIVVEADWQTILESPPEHSELSPKIVFRSVISWQQRFRNVHWWMCPGRRMAEVVTFRMLECWLKRSGKGYV